MRVNYSPRAQLELLRIVKYYDDEVPGLGAEFKQELDQQIKLCCESPEIGMQVGKRYRRLVMDRFPYNIFYQIREQEIRVVAVAHQHRKPGYWLRRIKDTKGNDIREAGTIYLANLMTIETFRKTFSEDEKAHLKLWSSATPAQHLAWLEVAQQIALRSGALGKR